MYSRIVGKLEELENTSVVAFPDGSIDTYCKVCKGKHSVITRREEFIDELGRKERSFRFIPNRVEPGGQAPNMGLQASKLGADTRIIGHLDSPVFDQVDAEKISLGEPAKVNICAFDDGDIIFARETQDILRWDIDRLESKVDDAEEALTADLVCCANWASIPRMQEQLEKMRYMDFKCEVFSFDPGNLTRTGKDRVEELFDALGMLNLEHDVIVHTNTEELEAAAKMFDITGSEKEKLEGLREKAAVEGYVLHDKPKALASTTSGIYRVANLEADRVSTHTGAGDRFDVAVGIGRAAGWSWEEALALGNLCAVQYVENSQTAERQDLEKQVKDKYLG